ncbi:transient receptor potential cation channel subfamily A member 1-like [Mytilus trossulus]|uniref:transient receptor potential cation channel subfamily A member 1-like n=1 Tax=Mytilus trossulus TaxID=6551 RepID=UPI003004C3E7
MEYSNKDVINNSGKETKSDVMEEDDSKPQLYQLTTVSEVLMVTENPTPTRTLQTKTELEMDHTYKEYETESNVTETDISKPESPKQTTVSEVPMANEIPTPTETSERDTKSPKSTNRHWSKAHTISAVHPAPLKGGGGGNDSQNNEDAEFSIPESSHHGAEWSKVQGIAAVAPALDKHRLKVGDQRKIFKKVTVSQAVKEGLTKELESLLQENPEKGTETDSHGFKPIHYASRLNQAKIIEVLLKYNADKNGKGPYGVAPLHMAARNNCVEAVKMLIQQGASVDVREAKQKTPLHVAARRGNIPVIKVLLDSGKCNVNAVDEDKQTALHEATAHKQEKTVQFLVQNGANIFATDINDFTPFFLSAAEDMKDTMSYYLKTALQQGGTESEENLLRHEDKEGNTALHLAVTNNKLQVAQSLLERGSNVNSLNNCNQTPLSIAANNGDIQMVELLLKYKADVNVLDKDLMTPCHRAALHNRHKIIDVLMGQGADINSTAIDQYTPLLMASSKGHLETIQLLISNGAQIAETEINNKTVLHLAVESGHISVIEALLKEKGCFNLIEAIDLNDQTILHYAARNGNTTVLNTLIKHNLMVDSRDIDGKTPLHVAAENDNDNAIEILYNASQTELNDGDDDGRTPLMLACQTGHYKSVKTLLTLGADISARDEDSCTGLILAARHGYANIVKVLLDNYAEVNQIDKIKNTALHVACEHGHVDCIRILLRYHADVTQKNSYGCTPLGMAVDSNESEAAVALLSHSSWRDSMNVRNSEGFTPMKRLIQRCPEAALVVLDNCVEYSKRKKDDPNFMVTFDYTYIDPGVDDMMSKKSRFFAPKAMARYKRESLLSHILVQSNLMHKWLERGYLYFYINFLVFFAFLCCLQFFSIMMPKITTNVLDNVRQCPLLLNDTLLANPAIVAIHKELGLYSKMEIPKTEMVALKACVFFMVIILMLNQITMCFTTGWKYFTALDNWLSWTTIIATLVFLLPFNNLPCLNNWRAGWMAAALGWLMLMNILRGFSSIGIYFIMFSEVIITLLKVVLILCIFLMAFSSAFHITLANTPGFKDRDAYPLSTLSMMLGEFNYIDTFTTGANDPFAIDGYCIMFLFFLVMPLALMNFLTGIAVGDIETVRAGAYISKISIFIDKSYLMEIRFPRSVQRKWQKLKHTVYPNKPESTVWKKVKKVLVGSEEELVKRYLDTGKADGVDETDELKTLIKKQSSQITKLHDLQKQQQDLIKQMADHLHMDYKLDSFSVAESEMTTRAGH